jgi:hypothetical protein
MPVLEAGVTRQVVDMIADDFVKTRQALEQTSVVTCRLRRNEGGDTLERFRVTIKRDSFEFQSFARVEVWRRDGWTTVHYLHGEDARVADLPTCHVPKDQWAGAAEQFGDLATELLDLAARVVA